MRIKIAIDFVWWLFLFFVLGCNVANARHTNEQYLKRIEEVPVENEGIEIMMNIHIKSINMLCSIYRP